MLHLKPLGGRYSFEYRMLLCIDRLNCFRRVWEDLGRFHEWIGSEVLSVNPGCNWKEKRGTYCCSIVSLLPSSFLHPTSLDSDQQLQPRYPYMRTSPLPDPRSLKRYPQFLQLHPNTWMVVLYRYQIERVIRDMRVVIEVRGMIQSYPSIIDEYRVTLYHSLHRNWKLPSWRPIRLLIS